MKRVEPYTEEETLKLLRDNDQFYTWFRKIHWYKYQRYVLGNNTGSCYGDFDREFPRFSHRDSPDPDKHWDPATDPMEKALGEFG